MKNNNNKSNVSPLFRVFKNLVGRLTQSPDVYPIKFYMKGKRIRQSRYIYLAD